MSVDHIRYDLLVHEALRSVVRRVVADVAKNGLPGEHHFYISFDTNGDGVRISPRLKAQYPQEMTVVLQHQFWDLNVTDAGFEVGLSFGGVPERLFVPFEAIKGFFDPSVQFGLEFEATAEAPADESQSTTKPQADDAIPAQAFAAPSRARTANETSRQDASAAEAPAADGAAGPGQPPAGGAEVVRLDRFRKKERS